MGMFDFLKPHNRETVPAITDNVRDSGQIFYFGKSDSGEVVNERSSMQIATVYACVRLLAESVAGLPLHLYEYTDEAEQNKQKAKEHPLYKILYRQPNDEMTSFTFRGDKDAAGSDGS